MNNLFSHLCSKGRLNIFGLLNIRKGSVVLLVVLGVAVSSCDTLGIGGDSGSDEPLTMEEINFRKNAVYTYEFLSWVEDTLGNHITYFADSVFNVFEIKNVLQDTSSDPVVYTDYMADIGLVKRTLKIRQTYENGGSPEGPYDIRTRFELIDYQIKGEPDRVPL